MFHDRVDADAIEPVGQGTLKTAKQCGERSARQPRRLELLSQKAFKPMLRAFARGRI